MTANAVPVAQRWMLIAVGVSVPLSAWNALYPDNNWLQVGPVLLLLPLAWLGLRRWPISNLSAACIAAFVMLHLFAAHWMYSHVPYDEWLGGGFDAAMGFERNMFDRLVHFLFGVLAMAPLYELGVRHWGMSRRMALVMAVLAVTAAGAVYEVFEWGLTLTLAPEDAGAYNGEQGDHFDAQKDMALATLGSLLVMPFVYRLKPVANQNRN